MTAKSARMVDEDGNPEIVLFPSSNAWSILADTRRALADAGIPDVKIGEATDTLLRARAGTESEVAARFVKVRRHTTTPKESP